MPIEVDEDHLIRQARHELGDEKQPFTVSDERMRRYLASSLAFAFHCVPQATVAADPAGWRAVIWGIVARAHAGQRNDDPARARCYFDMAEMELATLNPFEPLEPDD